MPMTAFHVALALPAKAVLKDRFSVPAFITANVAVDFPTAMVLFFESPAPLHGFTHTIAGVLMLFVAGTVFYGMLFPDRTVRELVAWFNGLWIGLASHFLLDASIYADMQPWFPFHTENNLRWLTMAQAEAICVVLGMLGLTWFVSCAVWRYWRSQVAARRDSAQP